MEFISCSYIYTNTLNGVCFLFVFSFTHTNNSLSYERHTKRVDKRETKHTDTHIHILEVQSCHHTQKEKEEEIKQTTRTC